MEALRTSMSACHGRDTQTASKKCTSSASTRGLTQSNRVSPKSMIVQTWGYVKTRPNNPWTRVELRAEPGTVLRISGTSYSSALASFARVRSALQSVGISWPGKTLTLHLHPPCSSDELAWMAIEMTTPDPLLPANFDTWPLSLHHAGKPRTFIRPYGLLPTPLSLAKLCSALIARFGFLPWYVAM